MKQTSTSIHRITFLSLCIAIAMILGYIESLVPFIGIPGMKLGLPNIVILWILYTYDFKDAFLVNIVRILLNSILFGNIYSFLFSLSGGMLSLLCMYLLKNLHFHIYTVSMIGGVTHNLGQCIIATLTTSTQMLYYLPILLLCGMICGSLNGILSNYILKYMKNKSTYL